MIRLFQRLVVLLGLFVCGGWPVAAFADAKQAIANALLADGLAIELFAENLVRARQLAVKPDGTVAVGSTANAVYLLRDEDGDGKAEWRRDLKNLAAPHGVAWLGDDLYIGESARILVVRNVIKQFDAGKQIELELVIDGLPSSSHHGTRSLAFDEQQRLHIGFGVPCNICLPPDPDLTGTLRYYDLTTGEAKTIARGFRNPVGFDWHPQTGELWATDHGRDWLGDELPSDEFNRVREPGLHFGFPYCHQGDFADPEFGHKRSCSEFEPPALKTGPHVANNGVHFYQGELAPFSKKAFIALHGSWNRSSKIGYAVYQVSFSPDGTTVTDYQPLLNLLADGKTLLGLLDTDKQAYGRPVDIDQLPDGSLLVSDDANGAVYRIIASNE